jgi:hypothetical protein
MRIMTTEHASVTLGVSQICVQKWCARLGIPKLGRDYIISERDLEKLRQSMHFRPGRPWQQKKRD